MYLKIRTILLIGFLLRLLFGLFGAQIYYGRDDFYADTDTYAWLNAFINLVETGNFSVSLDNVNGYFGRIPGYSFILGFFYLVSFKNIYLCFTLVIIFQILFDTFCIYLIYLTSNNIFNSPKTSLLISFLYATYPFIIFWNPIAYSECIAINFMILGFYLLTIKKQSRYIYFLTGLTLAASALNRPQIILLVPVIGIAIYFLSNKIIKDTISYFSFYCLGFLILFAPWPIRNYVNHNRIILTQDIHGIWSSDKVAFRIFIYTIKSEGDPQFTQLMYNKKVEPFNPGLLSIKDSIKLEQAYFLIKNCGFGYRNIKEKVDPYIEKYTASPPFQCEDSIVTILNELRKNMINNNPINYYIILPLQNIKKAFFKFSLQKENRSTINLFANALFLYRTLLIFTGLLGLMLLFFSDKSICKKSILYVILVYFCLLYILLCTGDPAYQFRNIEMRYFLPADILMILPAGFLAAKIFDFKFFKMNS